MAGEMEKDYKHEDSVLKFCGQFFPLTVESFGFWTAASLQTLRTIAAKTTTYNGIGYSRRSPTSYRNSLFDCGNIMPE